MPRISVVVPIYDVESYLAECLRSLAAQTVRDLEVVMVDDGSTDGSAAIAERFVAQDRRFRLISQANAGLGHARNTGVAAGPAGRPPPPPARGAVPDLGGAQRLPRLGAQPAGRGVHRHPRRHRYRRQ